MADKYRRSTTECQPAHNTSRVGRRKMLARQWREKFSRIQAICSLLANARTSWHGRSHTPAGVAMVIAERRLFISGPSGKIEVPVRLFQPEQEDGMWICRYEIDWPDGKKSYFGAGVDSAQALVLALQTVGAEIYISTHHESGSLRWHESYRGYGFPVGANLRNRLIGDDMNL
jgi:hypothetical protein